jgi:hypothetical protein
MPATIVVDQPIAPIDSPVAIELRGFPPRRLYASGQTRGTICSIHMGRKRSCRHVYCLGEPGELRPDFRQTGRGRDQAPVAAAPTNRCDRKTKNPGGDRRGFREDEQGGKFDRMYRSQVRGIIMTKGVCTLLRAARRRAHVIG